MWYDYIENVVILTNSLLLVAPEIIKMATFSTSGAACDENFLVSSSFESSRWDISPIFVTVALYIIVMRGPYYNEIWGLRY